MAMDDMDALLAQMMASSRGRSSDGGKSAGGFDGGRSAGSEFEYVSIDEAMSDLNGMGRFKGGAYRRRAVDYILETPGISGSANDWHNLASLLLQEDDEYALKVARKALDSYPFDKELLGDAIWACANTARIQEGDGYIERALQIPPRFWDWYLPVHIGDFYEAKVSCCGDAQERDAIIDAGLKVIADFEAVVGKSDRTCNSRVELLRAGNRLQDARAALEEAIFQPQSNVFGTISLMPAAQCCLEYLSLLEGTGDYRKMLEVARRGYASLAVRDKTAKVGIFLYYEALALDYQISNTPEGFGNAGMVEQALRAYEVAYPHDSHKMEIEQRYDILCGKAGVTGRCLPGKEKSGSDSADSE